MQLFSRKNHHESGHRLPGLATTTLSSVRDVGGHDLGVVIAAGGKHATVSAEVSQAEFEQVLCWEKLIASTDSLLASCCSITTSAHLTSALIHATFSAEAKTEKKDPSVLLTKIARRAHVIFENADAVGMDSHPLSKKAMVEFAIGGISEECLWPPQARAVTQSHSSAVVDGVGHEVFELTADDDDITAELVETVWAVGQMWEFGSVRSALWFRPAQQPEGAISGRRVVIVDFFSHLDEVREAMIGAWLVSVSAKARLRVRRLWRRQLVGSAMAQGFGVMGWENFEVVR
ncbi:hypothetical protein ACP8NE_03360 [Corynebacterium ulcerans]|uniref:hypothetical protein n=1 Tax=Corynebacterium ulcerans TaxID=65058 RepID=UPI003D700411